MPCHQSSVTESPPSILDCEQSTGPSIEYVEPSQPSGLWNPAALGGVDPARDQDDRDSPAGCPSGGPHLPVLLETGIESDIRNPGCERSRSRNREPAARRARGHNRGRPVSARDAGRCSSSVCSVRFPARNECLGHRPRDSAGIATTDTEPTVWDVVLPICPAGD